MKLTVEKGMTFKSIVPYLSPVEKFCEEKIRNGSYDDWDERKHTEQWLCKVLTSINGNGTDRLIIYYLEEDGEIIGVVFAWYQSDILLETLLQDGITPEHKNIAQLTCFHVIEHCRGHGLGKTWLENEVLKDLRNLGIQTVYIRSSHYRALRLYEKLGEKAGNYIAVSDHKLYQRCGYVYKIDLRHDVI